MNDQDCLLTEQRIKAAQLRHEADEDERHAEAVAESNPSYSDYLSQRAQHKRWLASNTDGGA